MKVRYRPSKNIEFEIEGEKQKDLFAALAQTSEIFGETGCGHCKNSDIIFRVRNVVAKDGKNKGKSFSYHEMVCPKCGYYLPYGQHNNDQGTLFPNRKIANEEGELVYDTVNRGWRKPVMRQEDEEGE